MRLFLGMYHNLLLCFRFGVAFVCRHCCVFIAHARMSNFNYFPPEKPRLRSTAVSAEEQKERVSRVLQQPTTVTPLKHGYTYVMHTASYRSV